MKQRDAVPRVTRHRKGKRLFVGLRFPYSVPREAIPYEEGGKALVSEDDVSEDSMVDVAAECAGNEQTRLTTINSGERLCNCNCSSALSTFCLPALDPK